MNNTSVKEFKLDDVAKVQAAMTMTKLSESIVNCGAIVKPRLHMILDFTDINTQVILFEHYVAILEAQENGNYAIVAMGWASGDDLYRKEIEIVDIRILDNEAVDEFVSSAESLKKMVESDNNQRLRTIEGEIEIPGIIDEIIKVWSAVIETYGETIH